MFAIGHDPHAALLLVLTPHRSLSFDGFRLVMLLFGLASFIVGFAFILMGAWPVFGWCGLDVAFLYYLFRRNYRDAAMTETIRLTDAALTLSRVHPNGRAEEIAFNPYWARLKLEERGEAPPRIWIDSHGRRAATGDFLPECERLQLFRTLSDALRGISIHHG